MKRYMIAVFVLVAGFATISGAAVTNEIVFLEDIDEDTLSFDERDAKTLSDTQIGGVRVGKFKDKETREKFIMIEINTYQAGYDETLAGYRMYVTAEVTDKDDNTYLVEYVCSQTDDIDSEYTGDSYWELYIPHGDLERPKVTAYAVYYGVMDDEDGYLDGNDRFVVIDEDFDDVDSFEELKERTTTPFEGDVYMKHYYMYDDPAEGTTESFKDRPKNLN